MSYFQEKDITSFFCIANLSKRTICKHFIKWWSRVRFGVAKDSVFWNYISNSNQLKIKSPVKSGSEPSKNPFNLSLDT